MIGPGDRVLAERGPNGWYPATVMHLDQTFMEWWIVWDVPPHASSTGTWRAADLLRRIVPTFTSVEEADAWLGNAR